MSDGAASAVPGIVPEIFERYARALTSPPSPGLREIEAHTLAHAVHPEWMTGPVEGAFLAMLVRLTRARRVLEIGLFTGYAALAMAEALPDDGELISCEIDREAAAVARSFLDRSAHGRKVSVRCAPALETLKALPPASPFDLAFLDADKENYVAYYETIVPLLAPGGLLVADNVFWHGSVLLPRSAGARAVARFNRVVRDDPRVECVMLTVRDGITLARKRP